MAPKIGNIYFHKSPKNIENRFNIIKVIGVKHKGIDIYVTSLSVKGKGHPYQWIMGPIYFSSYYNLLNNPSKLELLVLL